MSIVLLLASVCSANQNWYIKHAEVVRVSAFHDGYYHGLHLIFRADPQNVGEPELGNRCPATWVQGLTQPGEYKTVTWWSREAPGPTQQLMYATALAAQAQGMKIDLRIDVADCMQEPYRDWWGYKWHGASIGTN